MRSLVIYYQGFKIITDKLHLDWHPITLLAGTLYVTHLNAENIKIVPPPFSGKEKRKRKNSSSFTVEIALISGDCRRTFKKYKHRSKNRSTSSACQKSSAQPSQYQSLISRATIDAEIIQPFIIY